MTLVCFVAINTILVVVSSGARMLLYESLYKARLRPDTMGLLHIVLVEMAVNGKGT